MVTQLHAPSAEPRVVAVTGAYACPSCGAAGSGKYCSACGSLLRTRLPTVRELGAELVTDILGLQRRTLLSFWTLLFRPGAITAAYRDGTGAKFISPIRIYVAISALYFAAAALTRVASFGGPNFGDLRGDVVMALTLPVVAMWIVVLYGWVGGTRIRVSEAVSFALTFQAALFAIWLPLLAVPVLLPFSAALYAPWYVWRGARRLWGDRGLLAPVRAASITYLYFASILVAAILLAYIRAALY